MSIFLQMPRGYLRNEQEQGSLTSFGQKEWDSSTVETPWYQRERNASVEFRESILVRDVYRLKHNMHQLKFRSGRL